MEPKDKIIFALDFPSFEEAKGHIDLLKNKIGIFKIGLELFIKEGVKTIDYIKKNTENEIFLDLKLLDIPKTVERSVSIVKDFGVKFLTVHGHDRRTLEAAVNAAGDDLGILAVTVMTSIDSRDLKEQCVKDEFIENPAELVKKRLELAIESGCRGVICSPEESSIVKEIAGNDFYAITPGIRMAGNENEDQKRVKDPYNAVKGGSDYLVIGRPIRDAENPCEAAKSIAGEIARAIK